MGVRHNKAVTVPAVRDIASRLVWVLGAEKQLQPRRIRVGVSDGVHDRSAPGKLAAG